MFTILEAKFKNTTNELADRDEELSELKESFVNMSVNFDEATNSNDVLTKTNSSL